MKKQSTEGKKIFVNYISNKGLIPRIHKKRTQLNSPNKTPLKKPNQLNMGKGTETALRRGLIYV